jgi:uroporphyrinogen-III synthase
MAIKRIQKKHIHIFTAEVEVKRSVLSPSTINILRGSTTYDWIFFTSTHAVQIFVATLKKYRIPLPRHVPTAAVGRATKAAAEAHGFTVLVVPKVAQGDMLVRAWVRAVRRRGVSKSPTRILFPRSELALYRTVRMLRDAGAKVTPMTLYGVVSKKVSHTQKQALVLGAYTHLFFKSPSAVHGFLKQFTLSECEAIRKYPVFSIGATTRDAARSAGFTKVTIRKHS